MRKALVFSLILHLAVVVAAYLGVPMAQKELVAGSEAVAIDVVAVAEEVNLPPRPATQPATPTPAARMDPKPEVKLKPQVSAKPQPPAPPKPETGKVEPPPKADPPAQARAPAPGAQPQQPAEAKPQQVAEAQSQQAAEAQPPKPAPPAPVPERQAATAETQPPKAPPPPKPAQREKPAADQPAPAAVAQPAPDSAASEAKPAAATDFQSVLKTVDSLARNEPRKPVAEAAATDNARPEGKPPQADANETGAASSQPAFDSLIERALDSSAASASASAGTYDPTQPMSISEIDEVRRQIERCWNIPAGARDAGSHVVTIRVEMSPDATPRSAVVLNEAGTRGSAFHRAAAESALRAVLNPRCHPFRLPIEKYERWKTMTLVFNPKDMLGT